MNERTNERSFERVVFDCDSTLSTIEGVDELARRRGIDVAVLTAKAMTGELPMARVYAERMALIRPDRQDLAWLGQRYCETAVDLGRESVQALLEFGKEVRIISGGLEPAVAAFADWLGIPGDCVDAVGIEFDAGGSYQGFQQDHPLARNGGKREVLECMPEKRTAFVGDGMTDAEARGVVDAFFYFGGVVQRPEVAQLADARADFFTDLLRILLTENEQRQLFQRAPFVQRTDSE